MVTMMLSLTAYSQITGISTEQKKEIVKTLLDYPLVIEQLKVETEKNATLTSILTDEREKISIYQAIIQNKQGEINNHRKKERLYEQRIRRANSGLFVFASNPINSNAFSPELGLNYIFRNKLLLGLSAQYNNLNNSTDIKLGIGIKIF